MSRENPCPVGYWGVRELNSGPGWVFWMAISETYQYFQACLREYADWKPSDQSSQILCTQRVNGTINAE